MKISTRRDVDLPSDLVFEAISDFDHYETQARAGGASVERVGDPASGKAQAAWRIGFDYRGRARQSDARVVTYDPGKQLAIKGETDSVNALLNIELMDVAPDLTRMFVSIDMRPSSMTGRLLVQSLKLAKSALTKRLDKRLHRFAKSVEERHGRRSA